MEQELNTSLEYALANYLHNYRLLRLLNKTTWDPKERMDFWYNEKKKFRISNRNVDDRE